MSHVLEPVPEPFAPHIEAAFERYLKRDGYVLQLFRVFANSYRFLTRGTVNLLDRHSPLSIREREIVILRVCANNDCEYEWGVHAAAFSEHAGLTDDQVCQTRLGDHLADCWSEADALLIEAIDQLCAAGRLHPEALSAFQARWTQEQQLEILALCGNYHTICFVANTAHLAREPFARVFPGGCSGGRRP